MISGRFLVHLRISGLNLCCIYKHVSLSISCIFSAVKKENHTYCKAKFSNFFFFPNIVRCISVFLFNKSETLCGKWLWQMFFSQWAGTAPKPAWLPHRWALPGTLLPTWEDSPFPYAIPTSLRWGGLGHFRLFPSGSPLPAQRFELSSVLRFSSLLQKVHINRVF